MWAVKAMAREKERQEGITGLCQLPGTASETTPWTLLLYEVCARAIFSNISKDAHND